MSGSEAFGLIVSVFGVSLAIYGLDWIYRNIPDALDDSAGETADVDGAATAKGLGGDEAARGGSGQVRTGEDIARLHEEGPSA